MKRIAMWFAVFGLASGALLAQSVNLKIGLFMPSMRSDLWDINIENLTLDRADMMKEFYAAEYEAYLNRDFSFTLEVGSYGKTHFAKYRDFEYGDGSPIYQNVSLRIVPIEAGFNYYPMGHRGRVNPYLGFGGGVYAWTYQQWGDFINFDDLSVQEGFAESKRFGFGLNGRLGIVFRFQQRLAVALEGKYLYLRSRLSGDFEEFAPLDMSGLSIGAGLMFFFN